MSPAKAHIRHRFRNCLSHVACRSAVSWTESTERAMWHRFRDPDSLSVALQLTAAGILGQCLSNPDRRPSIQRAAASCQPPIRLSPSRFAGLLGKPYSRPAANQPIAEQSGKRTVRQFTVHSSDTVRRLSASEPSLWPRLRAGMSNRGLRLN